MSAPLPSSKPSGKSNMFIQSQALVDQDEWKNSDALASISPGGRGHACSPPLREGKLVGSDTTLFPIFSKMTKDLLSSFHPPALLHQEGFPEEILVPIPLKDASLISEILTENHHKNHHPSSPEREKARTHRHRPRKCPSNLRPRKDHEDLKKKCSLISKTH